MKYLLTLFAFISIAASAQQREIILPLPVNGKIENRQAWLYLPEDYSKEKRHPVVLYFHGSGMRSLGAVDNSSLPLLLNRKMRLDNIKNPEDGKEYSFIVLSVWNAELRHIPHLIRWLDENYSIDKSRVSLVGFSRGGGIALDALASADSIASQISAVIAHSPDNIMQRNFSLISKYKTPAILFYSNSDYYKAAQLQRIDTLRKYNAEGLTTILYSGNHCCSEMYFTRDFVIPGKNMTLWEWLLIHNKEDAPTEPESRFKSITIAPAEYFTIQWAVEGEKEGDVYLVQVDGKTVAEVKYDAKRKGVYSYTLLLKEGQTVRIQAGGEYSPAALKK